MTGGSPGRKGTALVPINDMFDFEFYCALDGMQLSKAEAYEHFRKHGLAEERSPSPFINIGYLKARFPGAAHQTDADAFLADVARIPAGGYLSPSPLLVPAFANLVHGRATLGELVGDLRLARTMALHPLLRPLSYDALSDAVLRGSDIGAHALFDVRRYVEWNPDLAGHQNPSLHYLAHGIFEGRSALWRTTKDERGKVRGQPPQNALRDLVVSIVRSPDLVRGRIGTELRSDTASDYFRPISPRVLSDVEDVQLVLTEQSPAVQGWDVVDAIQTCIDLGVSYEDCPVIVDRERPRKRRTLNDLMREGRSAEPVDLVIYTANIGSYEAPRTPDISASTPFYVFTSGSPRPDGTHGHEGRTGERSDRRTVDHRIERHGVENRGIEFHEIVMPRSAIDPKRQSLWLKTHPHLLFPHARATLWVDGNVMFDADAESQCAAFAQFTDIATFRHPDRNCIYKEAEAVIALGLDDPVIIREQMARYRAHGFPDEYGLHETNVMFRRNNVSTNSFNDDWWAEIFVGSRRDQLSFDYALWRNNLNCFEINGGRSIKRSRTFTKRPHKISANRVRLWGRN